MKLQGLPHPTALGDDRDVSRAHGNEGEVGVDRDLRVGILDALRIGSVDPHAVLMGNLDDLFLERDTLSSDLLKPRRVHYGELDPFLAAVFEHKWNQRVLYRYVDEVDFTRHVGDRCDSSRPAGAK